MKMTKQHFEELTQVIKATLSEHPDIRKIYIKKGLSETRLAWDILHASRFSDIAGTEYVCKTYYSYLNDSHITTALLKIINEN